MAVLHPEDLAMCIYTITHRTTGRVYVGQTKQVARRRWSMHCAPSNKSKRGIVGAIKKYGRSAFDFDVIDIAETPQQLNHKERLWIRVLNSLAPNGFNLEVGGTSMKAISEETRKTMRESRAAWLASGADTKPLGNGSRGRKRGKEEVLAIKRALTGRPCSSETREKIRTKQKGVPKPEAKTLEMARSRMNNRVVVCEDGHIYLSFYEAAKHSGLNKASIFAAASRNGRCGGLRWWLDMREG